jgi:arylsulfatase A-like enzyme
MWKTWHDIGTNNGTAAAAGKSSFPLVCEWAKIMDNLDHNVGHGQVLHQRPGAYNFPDMVMLGMPGCTYTEGRAQLSLWAVQGTPLVVSLDLRALALHRPHGGGRRSGRTEGWARGDERNGGASDDARAHPAAFIRDALTNADLLRVVQDDLALPGSKSVDRGESATYVKPLSGADPPDRFAVAVLNRADGPRTLSLDFCIDLDPYGVCGGGGGGGAPSVSVRDVWREEYFGERRGSIDVDVASHDVALLLLQIQPTPAPGNERRLQSEVPHSGLLAHPPPPPRTIPPPTRTPRASHKQRHSILLIMSDDLGVGDVGVYPKPPPKSGAVSAATPEIDRLATGVGGARFEAAYAGAPVCAPSRMTLMTGRHAGHNPPDGSATQWLDARSVTLGHVLRGAGYHTALIGKWGLDHNLKPNASAPLPTPGEGFPTRQGFDEFYGQNNQWECHNYFPSFLWRGNASVAVPQNANASAERCGNDLSECAWASDLFTEEAVAFLRRRRGVERLAALAPAPVPAIARPWFLFLSYTSPHAGAVGNVSEVEIPVPRLSASPFAHRTLPNGSAWPRVEKQFASAVRSQDQQVGRVLAELEAQALGASTVVIFTSDNGAHEEGGHSHAFFDSTAGLKCMKAALHEGGIRTPLVTRFPGAAGGGRVVFGHATFYDWLPTLAAVAGVRAASLPLSLDGRSLLPGISGTSELPPREFTYTEYLRPHDPLDGSDCPGLHPTWPIAPWGAAVRMGNWSAVCLGPLPNASDGTGGKVVDDDVCGQALFVYDLGCDPTQTTDLAAARPDLVARFRAIVRAEHAPPHRGIRP